MKRKLSILGMAMASAFGMSSLANASISFDPDGGGPLPAMTIGAFDWGPTTLFAPGGLTAIQNFIGSGGACAGTSCQFNLLTQAKVIGFLNDAGNPIGNPAGLNTTFELTLVARYTEVVTAAVPPGGIFGTDALARFATVSGTPGILEMYYDTSLDANAITGFGFNNGDLILKGTEIGDATSSFTTHFCGANCVQDLDQAGGNDYTGQSTQTGRGDSDNIPVDNLTQDTAFFLTQLAQFGIKFANISLGLPFISVDPSDCLTNYTNAGSGVAVAGGAVAPNVGCTNLHVNGLMSAQDVPGAPGLLPVIGAINAAFPGAGGGPDFIAQTDFNSPLQGTTPEPGSLALLGLGLGALGLGGFKRRSPKSA